MSIEIRAAARDELPLASHVAATALLHGPMPDEDWPTSEPSWLGGDSIVAIDDERFVGHVAGSRFDTFVPGGASLATSGVTRVGVLPTHTRRGLLRSMMQRLLIDARERGQVLASLRASHTGIYGRFGFGIAGHAAEVEIDARSALPFVTPHSGGSVRLLPRNEILPTVPVLYERSARQRPGALVRPGWMWERYLRSALPEAHDASHVIVHTSSDGTDDGYCHYELSWDEAFGREPIGRAEVLDLWGTTPTVEAALWTFVLGIDLVNVVRSSERPIDDLARFASADPRAYATKIVYDEQWLRLLDVDAALTARAYAAAVGEITVRVDDPWFPDNNGIWRLDTDGAERVELAEHADIEAGIAALSAAYLGGTSWHLLHTMGLVTEHEAGAIQRADALFVHHPAPFCGSFF